jgi:murein DD-endopeptidase MepM/ murein hydrolase activator NlpD
LDNENSIFKHVHSKKIGIMRKIIIVGILAGSLLWGCQPVQKKEFGAKKNDTEKSEQPAPELTHTYDDFGLKIDSLNVKDQKVKRNESLYLILDKYDFSPQQIYSITQQADDIMDLRGIRPGQRYRTYASADSSGELVKMVWQPNPIDYVVFNWQHDSLEVFKASRPLTSKIAVKSGKIEHSLYQTVSDVKASPLLAHKMADIFAWQINFFGLRQGDSFNVLYEKLYIDGEYYGIGDILAAEFTHRGETYRAYKFTQDNISGYFTDTGKSVQKALLKAPFKFSQRVSSRFSHNRMHPILKKRMPHYGVDFAAPYGTPVLSVGDGTVTEAQYRGANGNIVKITHNSTYRTAYLHLKGFARGIRRGAKVEQGQVIGYVGSTGRSTGPHLDYRLYRNGHPVNPLTVDLPSSDSVPDSLMAAFKQVRDSLDHRLKENRDQLREKDPVITQVQAK